MFRKKPLFAVEVDKSSMKIKGNLIVGAVIYGVGLGLGGLMPAVGLLLMPLESLKIFVYWGLACVIGMKMSHKLFDTNITNIKEG